MKRKIVKQGAATMMISLPSKWIKKNELLKGDEIDLDEKDNDIIISTSENKKARKEITIKLTDKNKGNIKNVLTHLYRRGYDKIIFENFDLSDFKEIKRSTRLLLGFEITEKDGDKCVLENISEPSESKYDVMLRKVFLIIEEQFDVIINDFETGKYNELEEIEDGRVNADKFVVFCRRLLLKEKYEKEALLGWELLTFLMHIHHASYYLYKYADENKVKVDKNAIKLLRDLKGYFGLLYDAYYDKDINKIHKINEQRKKYQFGECLKLIENSSGKNSVVFSHIREIFRLVQVGTSLIYGIIYDGQPSE